VFKLFGSSDLHVGDKPVDQGWRDMVLSLPSGGIVVGLVASHLAQDSLCPALLQLPTCWIPEVQCGIAHRRLRSWDGSVICEFLGLLSVGI
jgi:hypothetical protein